jgi:hypothetical protein
MPIPHRNPRSRSRFHASPGLRTARRGSRWLCDGVWGRQLPHNVVGTRNRLSGRPLPLPPSHRERRQRHVRRHGRRDRHPGTVAQCRPAPAGVRRRAGRSRRRLRCARRRRGCWPRPAAGAAPQPRPRAHAPGHPDPAAPPLRCRRRRRQARRGRRGGPAAGALPPRLGRRPPRPAPRPAQGRPRSRVESLLRTQNVHPAGAGGQRGSGTHPFGGAHPGGGGVGQPGGALNRNPCIWQVLDQH